MRAEYEHGDQVEARLIVWWEPGANVANARTLITHWRGDTAVGQDTGKVVVVRSERDLIETAAAWCRVVYSRHLRESHVPREVDPRRD